VREFSGHSAVKKNISAEKVRPSRGKMSGDPPTERLISVDIEVEGATAAVATTTTPDKAKDNRSVVGKKAVGGGEVNGNCILDEGFDSIQTYQGYSSACTLMFKRKSCLFFVFIFA
jgi:hypothetical protein